MSNILLADLIETICLLLSHQLQTLVEAIHPTVVMHRLILILAFQHPARLQRSRSCGVQTHHRHQRNDDRQLQTEIHSLVCMVVTLSQRPCKEFLNRSAQKISTFPFGHIRANLIHSVLEYLPQPARAFRRLRGILRHILHHCPQVQYRSPIDIPHICQQHMRLVTTTQSIIAWKVRMPLSLTISLRHDHAIGSRHSVSREPVPAVRTALLPSRTRMHTDLRCLHAMLGVPRHRAHQGGHQATHWLKIHVLQF